MDMENLSIDEMKKGYVYSHGSDSYKCISCNKEYFTGEIYPFENKYYEAFKAIEVHVNEFHLDRFKNLVSIKSKHNTLTDNQRDVLIMMHSGLSDKDIAVKLGITQSTVRNQRFVFREKAKQAKLYLAIYELALEDKNPSKDSIVPIHNTATMVDDRYVITEQEQEKILKGSFESLSPLKLISFSGKQKKKIVILTKIAQEFKSDIKYSEREVNEIIREIYHDFVEVRRYLIEYGFMDRTKDGKEYWLKK